MKKILVPFGIALFLISTVFAGRIEHVTRTVEAEKAEYIDIKGELGAGEFKITAADMEELAVFDITYNERVVSYEVDYYERNNKGFLTFESDHDDHGDFDDAENKWEIMLSTKYETILELDIGAADADIELGGLPLRALNIDIGAAAGEFAFTKRNPTRMKEMSIDAGASSLDMHMIGNANFEYCEFSGGVGSFDLDFRGEYNGESEILIQIGLGSGDITLPRNVPIRIISNDDNWFSSIDFHNDDLEERYDGEYESRDFAGAEDRIILQIDVGMGSVDLYWRD